VAPKMTQRITHSSLSSDLQQLGAPLVLVYPLFSTCQIVESISQYEYLSL
jgi:hypothetical protein